MFGASTFCAPTSFASTGAYQVAAIGTAQGHGTAPGVIAWLSSSFGVVKGQGTAPGEVVASSAMTGTATGVGSAPGVTGFRSLAPALFSSADYGSALLLTLPRGRVWPKHIETTQVAVMSALGPTFNRHDERAHHLIKDAFPGTAVELLPDWEASLGLPDPCTGGNPSVDQRQAQAVARLLDSGGQSAPHFIDYAAALGFPITITYFSPFKVGASRCGDRISGEEWVYAWEVHGSIHNRYPTSVLECELKNRAPAHTYPLFTYA
jgi:uncharacterized protein YmfQ (DUF2313 family)